MDLESRRDKLRSNDIRVLCLFYSQSQEPVWLSQKAYAGEVYPVDKYPFLIPTSRGAVSSHRTQE